MGKRIHIIEDDSDIRYIVCFILTELEYEVKVSDGIEDYKVHSQSFNPDLILMDIMLPDGNGLELCNQIKNNPAFEQIPVLIMSAHIIDSEVIKVSKANEFISKPFDIDYLTAMIKSYLS